MKIRKQTGVGFFLILAVITCALAFPVRGESVGQAVIADLDIYEADIRDVFRGLAEIGDINVLLDPTVKGEVTIKLKHGMNIKEAMELLAQTYGFSFRWITASRTMLIGNEKTFADFEMKETKVYQLNYAQTDQVVGALKVVVPADQIGIDKRTNQLTIKANILQHQNIAEIVERLDREMPQLNIEARVEELTRSASEELGLVWAYGTLDSSINFKVTATATIKALESQNRAVLLANPNISTTDSQEGRIFIGEKYPIISVSTTNNQIQTSVEWIEFGTSLTVTPRINSDDVVTVDIKAFVSSAKEWKDTSSGEVPIIATREASSVVRLREGETFALSGLNLQKETLAKSGVPGLAKIPLIGKLFGSKTVGPNEDTEIVIFLTPKIVKPAPRQVSAPVPLGNKAAGSGKAESSESSSETVIAPAPVTDAEDDNTSEQFTGPAAGPPLETAAPPKIAPSQTEMPASAATPVNPTDSTAVPAETTAVGSASQPGTVVGGDAQSQTGTQPESVGTPEAKDGSRGNVQTGAVLLGQPPLNTAAGREVKYKVKPGDTVTAVAAKFGINAEAVRAANDPATKSGLTAGTEITILIPEDHLYTLKPHETLWRLAKRYGTTAALLMEINNIKDHTKLEVGQIIILPVAVDRIADKNF